MTKKTFYLDIFHSGGHAITTAETAPPIPEKDYRRYAITVANQQLSSIAVTGSKMFAVTKQGNGDKVTLTATESLQVIVPPSARIDTIIGCNWTEMKGQPSGKSNDKPRQLHPAFQELFALMDKELPHRPMYHRAA